MRIKKDDRSAFDALCVEFYPSLVSYAMIVLSEDWAEDVVQDVLFSVWQHRKELSDNGSLSNYLFKSVHNRCLNYMKRHNRSEDFRRWNESRISAMALSSMDYDRNPVIRKLFDKDLRNSINSAIDSLPPRCQEVFRLSYLEDMSNKEISARLEISVSTVENHINSALKQLRRILSTEQMIWISLAVFLNNISY